jgi:hypothetical protein
MNIYLVKGEHSLGLFSAGNTYDLFWMVDRVGTPYEYQYSTDIPYIGFMTNFVLGEDEDGDACYKFELEQEDYDLDSVVKSPRDRVWHTFSRADAIPPKE